MKQKTICFYPSCQKRSNHFLFNLSKLLESLGDIRCVSYKDVRKETPNLLYDFDIYHINWFDQSKTFISFLKRFYFLIRLKLKGKRIVWTIHNIVSHSKTPFYNKILYNALIHFSDTIHIMCLETITLAHLEKYQRKIKLIPHGDYYNSYPESSINICQLYHINPTRPIFLFFGAIQPYKNIEVLIQAYRNAFKMEKAPILMICGKVEPKSYENTIQMLINNLTNIVFKSEFLPDEYISSYIQKASVLVVPYSYRSSLNSGTIPLAFSFGKTVICPDIACVKDIQKNSDSLYTYHYESEEDHIAKLSEKMKEAYQDILMEQIQEKEKNAIRYMEQNSWNAHKKEWLSLYGVTEC